MSIKKIDVLHEHKNKDGTHFIVTNGFTHIKYWGRCELNEKGSYNPLPLIQFEDKYIFGVDLFEGASIHSLELMMNILNDFTAGRNISGHRRILLIGFEEKDVNEIQKNSLPGGES